MAQPNSTIGATFAAAMKAYTEGKAATAQRLAARLVEANAEFGGGHYLLGLIALDRGQFRQAAHHLGRAVAITPGQVAPNFALARAQVGLGKPEAALDHFRAVLRSDPNHGEASLRVAELLGRMGERDEAIAHCRKALEIAPSHPEALQCLGALLLDAGEVAEAADLLSRALQAKPHWPAALSNYGLALNRLGKGDEAAKALASAVELKPAHAPYAANLAMVLRGLGRLDEAGAAAEAATRAERHNADCWLELGLVRQAQGATEAASAAFERAVNLKPDLVNAHWCLAEACRALGQRERATGHYQTCLDLDPADRFGAALCLALVKGEPPPDKAPEAYVRQLFDDFAEKFDATLVDKLEYRAPQLLDGLLARVLREQWGGYEILDAGCGTGLMAPLLRPRASRLEGVDLSPAMIAKAGQRGLYDGLTEADLVTAMAAREQAFDLIVAADVLVYVGELAPVMSAAFAALKDGGAFAFTVERDDQAASFTLGPKSRYAHSRDYVASVAAAAGFQVAALEDAVTRTDAGAAVPGLVAVLRKPD